MHLVKKLAVYLCLLSVSVLTDGCATRPSTEDSPSQIKAFQSQGAGIGSNINAVRRTALINTATALGAQAGLAWRSQKINENLERDARHLDQVFNFRSMLLKNNVLPPVLAEGEDSLKLDDPNTLRLADRTYKIISPPRFVTAPPNWREYLWMNYQPPQKPDDSLLPQSVAERVVWNEYVSKGWDDGVAQADQIFSVNLGRLKRDYRGMALYRILLAQNMVTPPYVATADLGVTGDANELRIHDQVLRITATSQLNPRSQEWRPVLVPSTQTGDGNPANGVVLQKPVYLK